MHAKSGSAACPSLPRFERRRLHSTSTAWHFVGGIGYGGHPAVARLSWPVPPDDRCRRRRQRQQRQHELGVERERQRPGERQRRAEHYLAAEELVVRIEQARQPEAQRE